MNPCAFTATEVVILCAGTNTDATFEALLGITAAGCICCPFNTRWSRRDVQHAVQLTTPTIFLLEPGFESMAQAALAVSPQIRIMPIVVGIRSSVSGLQTVPQESLIATTGHMVEERMGAPLLLKQPDCGTALICFTSGTTSTAKGVMISHAALVVQNLVKLAVVGYSRGDVYLHVAPLFHIGAQPLRAEITKTVEHNIDNTAAWPIWSSVSKPSPRFIPCCPFVSCCTCHSCKPATVTLGFRPPAAQSS